MKKLIVLLASLIGAFLTTLAGTGLIPAPESKEVKKQWLFKPLSTNDVSLEVERLGDNVELYLFSQNMKGIDMIYIEKSKDPTAGFSRCKIVKVSDFLVKSKNYISVQDDSPYDSNTDSYYRIKTVTSSGATKVYAAVDLSPIQTIEPETVDNSK